MPAPPENTFYLQKDINGLPEEYSSVQQLYRLSGAEPVWKAFWTPTENQVDWVEIEGLVSTGSIKQEVDRELHTYMAMSANITVDNTRGQWNSRGFWKNLSGESLTECRVTDTVKGTIDGLGKDEYYINPLFCNHWRTDAEVNLCPYRLYITQDKSILYYSATYLGMPYYTRILKKQNGSWSFVVSDYLGDYVENFAEIDTIVYCTSGERILRIQDNTVMEVYQEDDFLVLGMIDFGSQLLLFADRKINGVVQQGIYLFNPANNEIKIVQTVSRIPNIRVSFYHHNEQLWLSTANKVYLWDGMQFRIIATMPDIASENKKLCACQDKLFINHTSGGYNNIYSVTEDGIQNEFYYPHITYGSITDLVSIGDDKMFVFLSGKREIYEYTEAFGWLTQHRSRLLLPIATPSKGIYYQDEIYVIQHNSNKVYVPIFDGCTVYKNEDMPIDIAGIGIDGTENTNIVAGLSISLNNPKITDYWYVNLGWFGNRNVYEEKVRLWKGFRDYYTNPDWIQETGRDYTNLLVPAFTGMIDSISLSDIGGTANISLIDLNKKLSQVTAEKVTLDGSDGTLSTKLNVSTNLDLTGGSGKGLPMGQTKIPVLPPIDKFPASGKIKIDSEVIAYTSKIETADETAFAGCVRGADLTIDTNHSDGALVANNQWYVAPRMDKAVKALVQEAGIAEYQIDTTEIMADFEHFSYHGKTPSSPPSGVCRCICYDSVRDQHWMGIDDKLYLWKAGEYTLKATPEAGSYLYQIAVWEDTGDVFFVTSSCNNTLIDPSGVEASAFFGSFRLWKFTYASSMYAQMNSDIDTYKICYGKRVGGYCFAAMPAGGFFVVSTSTIKRLYYLVAEYHNWHDWHISGVNYIDLLTGQAYVLMRCPHAGAATAQIRHGDTAEIMVAYADWSYVKVKIYTLDGVNIKTATVAHTINEGYDEIYAVAPTSQNYLEEYWLLSMFMGRDTYNPESHYFWATVRSFQLSEDQQKPLIMLFDGQGIVDNPREVLPDIVMGFATKTEDGVIKNYFVNGNNLAQSQGKLYRVEKKIVLGIGWYMQIQDIGIPMAGQSGVSSNLCLSQVNGESRILGVAAPAYILWQYSKHSIVAAFNNSDFVANYGITPISSVLKSFAIASGFLSYFDEMGKYYFVKAAAGGTVLTVFAEEDVTNISEAGGNLAEYPIVNKAIVSLFDGTTQVYELPITSESRIKFGLETMAISGEWINNIGVASGLAKEIVDRYCMPKPVITGVVRWYPYLRLNSLIAIIKPSLGIWVKPKYNSTVNLPAITAGLRWQLLEITDTNVPPATMIRVRQV